MQTGFFLRKKPLGFQFSVKSRIEDAVAGGQNKTPSGEERGLRRSFAFRQMSRLPGWPYPLAILPFLMQLVQTRMRLVAPLTRALTACRLTFQRRRVTLCA